MMILTFTLLCKQTSDEEWVESSKEHFGSETNHCSSELQYRFFSYDKQSLGGVWDGWFQ